MAGRNTVPFGVSNSTKQNLRPNTTLLKGSLNYSDSSRALARTNGRRHSFVLDLFFVILPDYLFPSREKEKRSECRYNSFLFLFFWLEPKEPKVHPPRRTAGRAGQRTWTVIKIVNTFCFRTDGLNLLGRVYSKLMEALSRWPAVF